MVDQAQRDKPIFKGLTWYRDQHYSLFVPTETPSAKWPDGREGVLFQPDVEDNQTLLGVEVKELDITFSADDQNDLKEGFLEGIEALTDCTLEEEKNWVVGDTICLEAKFTYLEAERKQKRWIRVFYKNNRQITLIAQGSSEEAFAYWMPVFYEAMMTARVHDQKPELKSVTD